MRAFAVGLIAVTGALAWLLAARDGGNPALPPAKPTATPDPSPTERAVRERKRPQRVPPARCPGGVAGCTSVRGRVIYVERVDPDGDGDLHVVLLAGSVTTPGTTAVDVAKELRPRRDPRIGDVVAAAGPVEKGHLGQSQIHALVFRTR